MILQNTNSYILEYYNEIKAGNIIVGQELMMQLKKLVDEIQCRNVLSNNIRIDFEDSLKRINFIEKECKHYEAPHAGKPFILMLFQKAFIEAIFAIKIYDEELGRYVRKYQNVLFLVGRKNGKTPLIGAICLAEWFCGPTGLKILCASNDFDQADLMFQAINNMREESKTLERVTRKNLRGIFFGNPKQQKKKGKFSKQNKGNIKKLSARTNAKEGRNIGIGAVDEVFEMEDNSLVMPIRQALSTQDEPLYFELTTEGFTNGGYLDERLKKARQVLKGEVENERWLIWLYTQDNEKEIWSDESSWYKSNPGIGVIKKWSFLRQLVQEARTNSSTKAFVLAKDFNVKQNNAQAWLQPEDIKNDLTYDMEELRGCISIGGVDLSETGDLTNGRALILKPGSKTKYFVTKYFIPSSKLEQMEGEEKEKYLKWVKDGLLVICDDAEVNQSDVVAWFVKLFKTYQIKTIRTGYDKWQAKAFKNEMIDYDLILRK
jgi:phage terminase large subunit-like protein